MTSWEKALKRDFRSPTGLGGLRAVACLFMALGALTAVDVSPASAQATFFAEAASQVSLPVDAWQPSASQRAWAGSGSTACATVQTCLTVGSYVGGGSGDSKPFVVTSVNGVAGVAVPVSPPADSTGQFSQLRDVSCASSTTCVAIGTYEVFNEEIVGLIDVITGGQPAVGTEVALPADAAPTAPTLSSLSAVSCWSPGSCVAVGYYDSPGQFQPLVVPITNGVPGTGIEVAEPAGAAASGSQVAELTGVSCPAAGSCVAVGWYKNLAGGKDAMVVPITGSTPGTPEPIPLPGDAISGSSQSAQPAAGVSCWSSTQCITAGGYNTSEAFVAAINNGAVGTAQQMALPEGPYGPTATALSCSMAGWCAIVGSYGGSTGTEAMVVPVADGTASTGVEVALPADALTTNESAYLNAVTCLPTGPCVAAGGYANSPNAGAGMTVTVSGASVGAATPAPEPLNEASVGDAGLQSVGCSSTGSCVAFGQYPLSPPPSSTVYQVDLEVPLSITTTSLPPGQVGTPYQGSLNATGGWDAFSWIVGYGSLPAGLSLNAQTGAISGTPTTAGTSSFTVQATDTGTQTSSRQLSITVAAEPHPKPEPQISVSGGSLQVKADRLHVKLRCTGSACKGGVKVEASEVIIIRHGKKRVREQRTVVIGTGRFSIAAGRGGDATVTLNGTGRRLLGEAQRHRLAVRLVAKANGGDQASRSATIWAKAA